MTDIEVLPWATWFRGFARDYQVGPDTADHVTIIGPTGTGKTTIAMQIASLRRHVVALATKPRDAPFRAMLDEQRYKVQTGAGLPSPTVAPHVAIWPKHTGDEYGDARRHSAIFRDVFAQVYTAGGWHIVAEEGSHLIDLGLNRVIRRHFRAGRSLSSGLILCAQRPRFIPKEAISSAQHILIFGTNDEEDLSRLGGMNGMSSKLIRSTVAGLGRDYHFLHVNTRHATLAISRYEPPTNTRKN